MTGAWPELVSQRTVCRATQIGFAMQIFWRAHIDQAYSWLIPFRVIPAIDLGQIEFGFDEHGNPHALMSWAYVSDSVASELSVNPWRHLHVSEWNEGRNLWIVCVFAATGAGASLVRTTLDGRLAGFSRIRAWRHGADGSIRRLVDCAREVCPWPKAAPRRQSSTWVRRGFGDV